MPLVAYESSDDDEGSQGEEIIESSVISVTDKDGQKKHVDQLAGPSKSDKPQAVQVIKSNGSNGTVNDYDYGVKRVEEEPDVSYGDTSQLSVLKNLSEAGKKSSVPVAVTAGLSDIVVVDKKSKKIKVVIPSLDEMDCDSDEDEEVGPKRKITPAGGCSLKSLLPKPKNAPRFNSSLFSSTPITQPTSSSLSSASTTVNSSVASLIPHSISRPKTGIPPSKRPKKASVKSNDDDETPTSFFSFGDVQSTKQLDANIETIIPVVKSKPEAELKYSDVDYNIPTTSSNYSQQNESKQPPTNNINDPEFKKFIASKFGEEPAEKIDIVEVNVGSYLAGNHELLKSISMESGPTVKGPAPSQLAKRKNQITYLAYQAKQREVDLKNQISNNKFTKAQTRSRYGF
ncbi:proline-rich protein PRCC [Tetranychus urticae]|uniref:Proline-rich protein PRCC n=1 Tax=Tetranychus urticae TaxID=32264 RepID=T1KYY0_TETUR|nr:proline-rich protein PRCC [Tetranychus urticae]